MPVLRTHPMKAEPSRKRLKNRLRKEIRRQRAELDPALRASHDAAMNRHLLQRLARTQTGTIAAYIAFDGEPDLGPALIELRRGGVRLALPVINDSPGKSVIGFHHWNDGDELRPNRYGIPEPIATPAVIPSEIDLLLVPLVAWDDRGGRLGMGASFYDRFLQPFSQAERPLRMGVGYDLQRVDRLPLDPWDVPLHSVLSESGCTDFKGGI